MALDTFNDGGDVSISVKSSEKSDEALAIRWAEKLGLELNVETSHIQLWVSEEQGLSLSSASIDPKARLAISFHSGAASHRRRFGGGASQMIAKAMGIESGVQRPTVLDVTAGLGGDSFVLASLGAQVTSLERSPVLFAMLSDAFDRANTFAQIEDESLALVLGRMDLIQADANEWLVSQEPGIAEVIYLDPMFPERKKSAAVKKEMQILHELVGGEEKNEAALLSLALEKASHRVVVKRPRHAPAIDGVQPGYVLEGKSTRFDIYPLKSLKKGR